MVTITSLPVEMDPQSLQDTFLKFQYVFTQPNLPNFNLPDVIRANPSNLISAKFPAIWYYIVVPHRFLVCLVLLFLREC